ncbi:MAG TPA: NAD(P)/FAD-dependent oxidoreductase, partial [Candidatus Methylomirabilis sp.]
MTGLPRPRIVIVGAGFGGLWAVRTLAPAPVDALLVDRNNYHAFLPLLYQVAAAELEPEDIAYPIRSILRTLRHARFSLSDVKEIELAGRVVQATDRSIPYDFLILATGSVSHFFGVPGAAHHAFPLKTMEQGIALRNHILACFERAAHEPSAEGRRRALTFAIVGGGPTGVEFAGALAELIRGPLGRDFPGLDLREVRVLLLEARESIPPGLPEGLRAYTEGRLHRMGVEVRVRAAVGEVTPRAVTLRDGTVIPTETVVWTAGVRGDPSAQAWGLPAAPDGRVKVLPTLQVPGHPEVYVVGDLAYVEEDGRPLPMVAPVAIQQGAAAAGNILRQVRGADPLPFRYRDRGTMVTIGRNAAVACLGRRCFSGFPAWVVWLSVHIFKLIGFRNRL